MPRNYVLCSSRLSRFLVGLIALECFLGTTSAVYAFSGGITCFSPTAPRGRKAVASLTYVPRRKFMQPASRLLAKANGDDSARGGSPTQTSLLGVLEFVIATTFSSRFYVGSPELHVALPLPQPEDYPDWIPGAMRLPSAAYEFVNQRVEEGWIKKAPADRIFEIKYGVMRGEVNVVPDDICEPCELEKRKQLEAEAASNLVNIGQAERSRRSNAGYAIAATSLLAVILHYDV